MFDGLSSRAVPALVPIGSGKVRDLYEIDPDRLLIVASDRISAFDVVLDQPIPHKGCVLTGLSLHWFDVLDTPHHVLSADPADVPGIGDEERKRLAGRMMLVRRASVIPMECVVRGYLYGSSWEEYASGGGPTTEHLPKGLEMASRLPEPIFTPAAKVTSGHDENLTEAGARDLVGDERYEELRMRSIELYRRGAALAAARGIVLADTKFEFGISDGSLLLIDEVLTPDSSRYWPANAWAPGRSMPSFDKQPVRDWLATRKEWDGTPPPPPLPDDIVDSTSSRYVEAYERLSGESFTRYLERSGVDDPGDPGAL